jgi:hypothetical protein
MLVGKHLKAGDFLFLTGTNLNSNFRLVLNILCFLLGNSPASEFYISTFRNTLFQLHKQVGVPAYKDGTGRVFRNVGI